MLSLFEEADHFAEQVLGQSPPLEALSQARLHLVVLASFLHLVCVGVENLIEEGFLRVDDFGIFFLFLHILKLLVNPLFEFTIINENFVSE